MPNTFCLSSYLVSIDGINAVSYKSGYYSVDNGTCHLRHDYRIKPEDDFIEPSEFGETDENNDNC